MKEIKKYIAELTIEELVDVYRNEYLPFKKTGILPDGVIRNIANMFNEFSGSNSIDFATKLFMEACTETFYHQNRD